MTSDSLEKQANDIVEVQALLKNYLDSILIKKIKAEMPDDKFKDASTNQIYAALTLKELAPCSLKRFCTAVQMSKAAASALIERMVTAGFISRQINPSNRREIVLTITPEFEQHVHNVKAELTTWFMGLSKEVGEENFENWHKTMVLLKDILQEEFKEATQPSKS